MNTLVLAGLVLLMSAGAAAAETQSVAVSNLRTLEVAGAFRVEISTGPQTSAVLEGAPSELAKLQTVVDGQRLRVETRCTIFCADHHNIHVVLRVTAPALDAISISRGAAATASGLDAGALKLDISMGGALDAAGACDSLAASARMGAELDARHLICRTVDIKASMGADVSVHASESVEAHASMGASVKVSGAPRRHDVSAFMGGDVSDD